MKMSLTQDSDGFRCVNLSYDGHWASGEDGRIARRFTCPEDGGYVRERRGDDWKQVCEGLGHRGSTLTCTSREALPELIRREYQAMRRAEQKQDRLESQI